MYQKYPMIGYLTIKQQRGDFDYSPTLKARYEKAIEESKAINREAQRQLEDYLAKHPQNREYMPEPPDPAEVEMYKRVADEELERMKTLPPARRNIFKEIVDELKYRYVAIRYYWAFSLK